MVQVYSTLFVVEADIIKSILEENGIKCVLLDKHMGTIYPAVVLDSGIRVMVEKEDSDEAHEIIREYLRAMKETEDNNSHQN